jgi:hypothetical protein
LEDVLAPDAPTRCVERIADRAGETVVAVAGVCELVEVDPLVWVSRCPTVTGGVASGG